MDDFLPTIYTIIWIERDLLYVATVDEQTSYTITGLRLDTVYTVAVRAANMCGQGPWPEVRTTVTFFKGTICTIIIVIYQLYIS